MRTEPVGVGLLALTGPIGVLIWLVVRRQHPRTVSRLGLRRELGLFATAIPLFLVPILLVILATTFVLQMARVQGMSMAPTVIDQDRLMVNKLAYRIRDPHPGDIVMLQYPLNPERKFIMRVIADAGSPVQLRDGQVYVNGQLLNESYVAPEFRSHDNWGPRVVPEGYYFVLGDRRNNSADSRHWGFVPKKYIIGRVASRWWPMGAAGKF